jgi:2-dehydro-3-deoxygluconokinase
VVTLGECMALVYPDQPISLVESKHLILDIAGAESNFSIALSRLGHSIRFISRLGADPFGERIRQILNKEGVVLDSITIDQESPTGLFFREWLPDGQRRVYYYRKLSAASKLSSADIIQGMFKGVKILHLTGITPALSHNCLNACLKAIEIAKQKKIKISFDPNYRSNLWDPGTARNTLIPFMQNSDFLLLGHEDALSLFGEYDEEEIIREIRKFGPMVIILKRGERGALALIDNVLIESKPIKVDDVVDPVGAGDGFDAGFIAGILRGWDISSSLNLGARVGASAVSVIGDYEGYPIGI